MDEFVFEFTCSNILFRNEDGFTILKAKNFNTENNHNIKEPVIKGYFENIDRGDSFRGSGIWVQDPNYGLQIKINAHAVLIPSNIRGLKRFLRHFIKGIGKTTADRIVDTYGTSTLEKLRTDAESLVKIKGISEKKAKRIMEQVDAFYGVEKLSVFLFKCGITNFNDIIAIYDSLKEDALDKLHANPYCLCDVLSISRFPIADKIALSVGRASNDTVRLAKIIQFYISNHVFRNGDMYVIEGFMKKELQKFIRSNHIAPTEFNEPDYEKAIDYLLSSGVLKVELCENERYFYLQYHHYIETHTADIIKKINHKTKTSCIYNAFFEKYFKKTGIMPDELQQNAVSLAYENRLSVLTGGPGTGKTQTVNMIISFFEYCDKDADIVLCAPTGRAAQRMSELTGREASTIHRLLGITADDNYEPDCELDCDLVICDESSMIDAPLFYKLLSCVARSDASILFVGDKDQLPPVGVGLPFKDLIESGVVPTIRLTRLFRQAKESQINHNANMVLNGVTHIGENGLHFDLAKQDFFFFNGPNPTIIQNTILASIEQLLNIGYSMNDIMVLSPMNKTPVGVIELNRIIQEYINPITEGEFVFSNADYEIHLGDRVMQTSNNYELGVFNGDIGHLTKYDEDDELLIVSFPEKKWVNGVLETSVKDVEYSFAEAKSLVLAYTTTVHKAQGSEFPCVIMPLSPVLINGSRNILYTAITRSISRFIMVGDMQSLVNNIQKIDNMQRRTMLSSRLAA